MIPWCYCMDDHKHGMNSTKLCLCWPDLRGLGDSSKPLTGYDGNTTAEDLYQLISQLDLKQKINLVGHDIGVQTAYSYAAIHPDNVSKLVILDVPVLGILPKETDS